MVGIVTVLVLILLDVIPGRKPSRIPKTTLEVWGVFDDRTTFEALFGGFIGQEFYKNVTINYSEKFIDEYEDDLINTLAEGRGPDIFMIHNTWLPKHRSKIDPWLQDEIIWNGSLLGPVSARDYQITFVDVASNDFVRNQRIYAFPLYIDTLALFYNKDMFNTAGIPEPPRTWKELEEAARTLTRYGADGRIARPGIPLGSAVNINRSTDILSLLFLQNEVPIIDTTTGGAKPTLSRGKGVEVLDFYTSFAKSGSTNYVWDPSVSYSIDSFYQGETAMMINYSHHIQTLEEKNPHFRFDVASIPQSLGGTKDISYANFWGFAVSKNSENKKVAHELIRWMSQKDVLEQYAELTRKPTSRRDLILWQGVNYPELEVFVRQTLTAESWYQPDQRRVETVFEDMIESVVSGERSPREALQKAENELGLLIR